MLGSICEEKVARLGSGNHAESVAGVSIFSPDNAVNIEIGVSVLPGRAGGQNNTNEHAQQLNLEPNLIRAFADAAVSCVTVCPPPPRNIFSPSRLVRPRAVVNHNLVCD